MGVAGLMRIQHSAKQYPKKLHDFEYVLERIFVNQEKRKTCRGYFHSPHRTEPASPSAERKS